MNDPGRVERKRIREQAVDWMLRVSDPNADDADRSACERWRVEDPRHEEAYQLAARAWTRLPETDAAQIWQSPPPEQTATSERSAPRLWIRRFTPNLAILAPVGLAAAIALIFTLTSQPPPDNLVTTPVGEIRHLVLDDGSQIDLGAASRIRVAITDRERRVALEGGQAFFDVAHDEARPFLVEAGDTEIRVTGTKFDVWALGDHVQVSVAEGSVVVRRPSRSQAQADEEVTTLHAGERATVEDDHLVQRPSTTGQAGPGEWRTGRLFYANAPLDVVVADANRYTREPILILNDELKATRVTVSFRTAEIEQLLGALEGSLPVQIERQQGYVTIASR